MAWFEKNVIILENLPKEKIENIRFVYIVIDSQGKTHYEFNNKGHIVLPINWSEINPYRILKNLPKNLIARCISNKDNLVGVLQLWVYYTKHHIYARVKAAGILEEYQRQGFWKKLNLAMAAFCHYYNIEWVERETSVIPAETLLQMGFLPAKSHGLWHRFENVVTFKQAYIKRYR